MNIEKKHQSQMVGLIGTQVVLNFLVGIFASKIEEIIGIKPITLATVTLLALFSLTFVTFRLWKQEQRTFGSSMLNDLSTNTKTVNPFASLSKKVVNLEYFMVLIPIGITVGALLAVVLVPIFPNPIELPINIDTKNIKADATIEFAHWYELIGVILLSAASMVVALKWHGLAGLLLLLSSMFSFVAIFVVLAPENHFLLSLLGWAIPVLLIFAMIRGVIALVAK